MNYSKDYHIDGYDLLVTITLHAKVERRMGGADLHLATVQSIGNTPKYKHTVYISKIEEVTILNLLKDAVNSLKSNSLIESEETKLLLSLGFKEISKEICPPVSDFFVEKPYKNK